MTPSDASASDDVAVTPFDLSASEDALRESIAQWRRFALATPDDEALAGAEVLVDQARASANVVALAEALWLVGDVESELGRPEKSILHLAEAADLAAGVAYGELEGRILLDLAELRASSSDRIGALTDLERARDVLRSSGLHLIVARCDDQIATAQAALGRLDLAEQHLRAALAVWEATADADELARARYRLGRCLAVDPHTHDRGAEALQLLQDARTVATEREIVGLVAACDEMAARVLAHRGEVAPSVTLFRGAAAVFDALGDDEGLATTRVELARNLLISGSPDEAEFLWRRILDTDTEVSARTRLAAAVHLARHLAGTERAREALEILERVAPDLDVDDRTEGPVFHVARAEAFHHLGMVQATIEAADAALDLLDRALLPGLHAAVLECKGRAALASGRRGEAESLLGQALALLLIDGDQDRAARLAAEIVPEPPSRPSRGPLRPLATGLYL